LQLPIELGTGGARAGTKLVRNYQCEVTGLVRDGRADEVLQHLDRGDRLALQVEPFNTPATSAVAVYHNDVKIGYIPHLEDIVRRSLAEGDDYQVSAVEPIRDAVGHVVGLTVEIAIVRDGIPTETLLPQQESTLLPNDSKVAVDPLRLARRRSSTFLIALLALLLLSQLLQHLR
jgi:hypothetical protein